MGKGELCGCPPIEPNVPYDELSHQIGKTDLSVRVSKKTGKFKNVDGSPANSKEYLKTACAKVNVVPNTLPPKKCPDEEQLLIRTSRQILNSENMRNILEIKVKLPRNYEKLPDPPPFKILYPEDDNSDENPTEAPNEEKK